MNRYEQMEIEIQNRIKDCIKYKEIYTNPNTSQSDKDDIKAHCKRDLDAYAWPGGYPIFYVTKDGGILCPKCANENIELLTDRDDPQWYIVGRDINYEDTSLYCDHCNTHIESAYGDDEE